MPNIWLKILEPCSIMETSLMSSSSSFSSSIEAGSIFVVLAMPAGLKGAIAVAEVSEGEWNDPAVLSYGSYKRLDGYC